MASANNATPTNLAPALKAIANLTLKGLDNIFSGGYAEALAAHTEIGVRPVIQKRNAFYNHFYPLRSDIVAVLAENYRRYFKLALAHPRESEGQPEKWAWYQLEPAVGAALEWIREWFILACEGENRYVRRAGSIQFAPGQTASLSIPLTVPPSPPPQSWRAPSWLFQISLWHVGVGPLKTEHVPANDSEEKLSAAHTRLLLRGARRVFLWALRAVIENVSDEETAAAGAIPAETTNSVEARRPNQRKDSKRSLKGVEGLGPKHADLSRYMRNLTDKQQLAFSLKYEYELPLSAIASRMGINRKTADEHIEAAKRKVDQGLSADKSRGNRSKITPE